MSDEQRDMGNKDEQQLVIVVQYHDGNGDLNMNFRDQAGKLHLSLAADVKSSVFAAHTADLAAVLSGLMAVLLQKGGVGSPEAGTEGAGAGEGAAAGAGEGAAAGAGEGAGAGAGEGAVDAE